MFPLEMVSFDEEMPVRKEFKEIEGLQYVRWCHQTNIDYRLMLLKCSGEHRQRWYILTDMKQAQYILLR